MSIQILLVDDHKIFRQGLRGILAGSADVTVVGEAEDGRSALAQVVKLRPDVVIMDVGMPNLNGIEATRDLKRDVPRVRVIALSMHVDEKFVAEMLRAGAVGYLCKKCDADELLVAIRTVNAGQTYLSPAISCALVEGYLRHAEAAPASSLSRLTDRERRVLQLLAEERSVKEIAAELNISVKTVYVHREHLMRKLDVQTVAGLAKYAVREGLAEE